MDNYLRNFEASGSADLGNALSALMQQIAAMQAKLDFISDMVKEQMKLSHGTTDFTAADEATVKASNQCKRA